MNRKKEFLFLGISGAILLTLILFSVFNWNIIKELFGYMINGVEIVKESILDLGIVGVISMSIIIIICFFFPVISSLPIQIASAVSYGLLGGCIHVLLSVFLASQLVFLFTRNVKLFYSKKKLQQQLELEEKIKNSKRSILYFVIVAYLAPFIPFLLIHMIAASSGMKWWKYSLITLIGPIPDIVVTLVAGVKITSTTSPVVSFVLIIIIIACVITALVYKNKIVDLIFLPKRDKKDGKN